MLASIRRIGNALVIVSVVSLSLSLLSSVSLHCGSGEKGCLATVFTASFLETDFTDYKASLVVSQTSPMYVEGGGFTLAELNTFVQLTSGYILLVAVLILIALECLELHYIRRFFQSRIKKSR